ncbi:MAG: hypothetical protein IJJ71_06295 [Treponema sp.]|uniref:hypothetical protein n=1 Tax=Treponema sp. TaxID=166 RepID=UPI0025D96C15|nr:hypothetical protein [Treponema sp.]MBR0495765.1 hypothetical protein [Treponema sp.]
MEYASNAKANAALTTGIIGTVLGGIASAGGIGAILGLGRPNPANMPEDDRPVTRYEMGLIQENNRKDTEIAILKSQQYTDRAMVGVQAQFAQQTAWNAVQGINIQTIQNQLASITKFMVPISAIVPEPLTAEAATASAPKTTGTGSGS